MFIKYRNIILRLKYELLIFTFLLIEFFNNIPLKNQMNEWCTTPYLFTYKLGINSRFLIGSIVKIFNPYLSIDELYSFIILAVVVLCYLVSICIGKVLKSTEEGYKFSTFILVLFFITSPASISFLFNRSNFGRLDLFLLIGVITTIFFMNNKKLKYFIPIICIICILIHQVFVFTYFVLVVIILIFNMVEENISASSVILTIVTIVTSSISFFYIQLYNVPIPYTDVSEIINILKLETNVPISYDMINYEYFLNIRDHLYLLVYSESITLFPNWRVRLLNGLLVIIILSPIILVIYKIWLSGIKVADKKYIKIIIALSMIAPLTALPAFALTIDWGRWFASVFIVQFSCIYYLIYKKCYPILIVMENMQNYLFRNLYIVISIIAYMSIFDKFRASEILVFTNRISTIIMASLKLI